MSGSCRWHDPSHHSLVWGRTCPLSCQTSTWTGCRLGSRPFVSSPLWGILMHFCGMHTSPLHAPDHRNLGLDTWGDSMKYSQRRLTQHLDSFSLVNLHLHSLNSRLYLHYLHLKCSNYWRYHPVFHQTATCWGLAAALWYTLQSVCLLSGKTVCLCEYHLSVPPPHLLLSYEQRYHHLI